MLTILPPGCNSQPSSEFLPTRYPLLGFDFILPATCIQKDIALD